MAKIEVPGPYKATVKGVEFGELNNEKKTPYLRLDFETEDGARISRNMFLSDAAFPYTLKNLQEAFKFNGDFHTLPEQVVEKPCQIVIEEETDDKGNVRMIVKWVNAASAAKPIANKGAFLAALTAKAKGAVTGGTPVKSGAPF